MSTSNKVWLPTLCLLAQCQCVSPEDEQTSRAREARSWSWSGASVQSRKAYGTAGREAYCRTVGPARRLSTALFAAALSFPCSSLME